MESGRDAEFLTQSVRFHHFCLSKTISQSVGAHHQICRNASRLAGNFSPEIPEMANWRKWRKWRKWRNGRNTSVGRGGMNLLMAPINRTNEQTSEHRENDRRAAFTLRTRSRSLIFAPEFKFSRTRRPSLSGSLWSGINFSGRSSTFEPHHSLFVRPSFI